MIPAHARRLSGRAAWVSGFLGACVALGCCRGGEAQPPGPAPIYRFDPGADKLLGEMFPRRVAIAGVSNAYAGRGKRPRFANLQAVIAYHSESTNTPEAAAPGWWDVGDDTLESAWPARRREPAWPGSLLAHAGRVAELARVLAPPAQAFATPLEKALFQRDVLQMCMVWHRAARAAKDPEMRKHGERALAELGALWRRLLLTAGEHEGLNRARPRRMPPGRFSPVSHFDLSEDYLPARVLADEAGWYELIPGGRASVHFEDFGGRSFIRVFVKPAGWTREQLDRYWDEVARKFGVNVTRDGRVPPLPAGTETLLLRTFGVFLEDGSYADSGYPEEVLLRLFKHADTRLDMSTSDYRGTLLYRYRMLRRDLLADTASLGLRRVREDDPQFAGFLSEVPDPRRAYAPYLTTMRNNCIACHSELFYGASTVFSLGRQRLTAESQEPLEGGLLRPAGKTGRFRLETPEFKALQPYLNGQG